ncbi:MAG TPA: triose-phosphate isomerase [Patescibacteria group bacterium]|nr:triose-phosphate isomerase [Patescibacteria group bacterium]
MKKFIFANWKLNPTTLKAARQLAAAIPPRAKHQVVLCPPAVYLAAVDYPRLGAQDCFWEDHGAFTGQVSAAQLKDLKIKYCLVGHSEKRAVGEIDAMISAKLQACLRQKITPVLCVGYGATVQQDDLEVMDLLKSQLDADLSGVPAGKVIVAYEPVWAIGTGRVASPEHAERVAIFIKSKYGVARVLYGGSVVPQNAAGFLAQPNVGGLLVGGASLRPKDFNQIINF